MNLDYATLISPFSLYLENIGHIRPIRLKDIWLPEVTYKTYSLYLSLMLMKPLSYFEQINPDLHEQYNAMSDEDKSIISMFNIIANDQKLREQYCKALSFFMDETVLWDAAYNVFITCSRVDNKTADSLTPIGAISEQHFAEVCDVILQLNGVDRNEEQFDEKKVKNKYALEVLRKLKKGIQTMKKKNKHDPKMELPNLISAISCKHNSINLTNIWDLTVYQLYDQFHRLQINNVYNIKSMSLAAWGDKNNTFDYSEWYKNI